MSRPGDSAERAADHASHELLAGRPARLVPGSEPFGIYRQSNAPDAAGTDARALVRAWLEKHEFAPPVEQPEPDEAKDPKPDEGEPPKPDERKQPELHVLLNGEDMTLSRAVQLAAGDPALHQPADLVKEVIVAALAGPAPTPGGLFGGPIIGPGNSVPGIPAPLFRPTLTGGRDPVIGKAIDLGEIDRWLDAHDFYQPSIPDPRGARVVLDGRDTTIEEVADRAMAIVGSAGPIKVAFVTRQEVLVHLRQRYVAAPGAPATQIVLGYTLGPKALQAVTPAPDPNNPLRTQHQFSFTITRTHHDSDSPGLESSFQGSVTINDAGEIVNIQAGGQEAVVAPLLGGWIQISGFLQVMASANWSKTATGTATVSPAVQAAVGGQILVTPKTRPVRMFNGHVALGAPQFGLQGMGSVQESSQGPQAGATVGLVINIQFSL